MALLGFPVPPAIAFLPLALEVGGAHRAVLADPLDDLAYLLLMGREPVGRELPTHGGGIQHAMAQQPVVFTGNKTGLVGPVFEEVAPRQQLLKPGGLVLAEAAEQHQIGAARHYRDGVYLQQRHALNAGEHVGRPRLAPGGRQQPLGRKLQVTGVLQGEMRDRHGKPLLGCGSSACPSRRQMETAASGFGEDHHILMGELDLGLPTGPQGAK
ncbi:hypothetical protein D3C79_587410 [compost metagenome]